VLELAMASPSGHLKPSCSIRSTSLTFMQAGHQGLAISVNAVMPTLYAAAGQLERVVKPRLGT
jgi:hypothetical protein